MAMSLRELMGDFGLDRVGLKPGDPVVVKFQGRSPDVQATVKHAPARLIDGSWAVWLEEITGPIDLASVHPVPKPAPPRRRKERPGKFWCVWSPQGGPPTVKIGSFVAARGVARKLGKKVPERDFYVLESVWGKPSSPAGEGGRP